METFNLGHTEEVETYRIVNKYGEFHVGKGRGWF